MHSIYLDHHATTPTDPCVVEAMLPFFTERFGNAGSATHEPGRQARRAVDEARQSIADCLGADSREIVFTSGATESNNLALRGAAERYASRGRHLISVATEHPSVLESLSKLARAGYEVTLLPVAPSPAPEAGLIRPEQLAGAIRSDTILVSVMLANNEIGVLQPVEEIGRVCREHGVVFHCDATQAVGRLPVDVDRLQVDLMSFTAHKIYGPKGIGALYVRRRERRVSVEPILVGGGQEAGLRSGTLNVPGIVGFARALELCRNEMATEAPRLRALRDRTFERLCAQVGGIALNGPSLDRPELRLAANLNVAFSGIDAESLLATVREVALSAGSACGSSEPEPSHVLRALGLPDPMIRSSVRFGLGRWTTEQQIDQAVDMLATAAQRLRSMLPVAS
ncbi:MAG: cysteine desulfurase family protein [Thermoguttaceae bacterium]|jgi:cysteine desulfurase|nr:cysteine desulfurase family protein [Thermoguttaceae bacterium]